MTELVFENLNSLCIRITDGSHYSPKSSNEGFPMLSVKDMLNNGFDYSECKLITKKDYLDLAKADCKPLLNDVVIAKDGSYLKHVFVIRDEIDQAVLSSIGILRPNLEKLDPYYLKYYLQSSSVKEVVSRKYVSGSALPRIILKNFGEIEIIYKPLNEQKKISKILSDIDTKIEVNNKINAKLESMAKLIYDYWFVQFDFPDENGKPYKSSGGKMIYNEELKREIPEGWEVKELGDVITLLDSKRIPLSKSERQKRRGKYPYYGATGIMDYVDDFIFDGDYILLAEDGSVMDEYGFPIVQFIWGKNWVNNHAHVIQSNNKKVLEFVYQMLKMIPVVLIKTGSIQMKINQENLLNYKVLIPTDVLINSYSSMANKTRKMLINNIEENSKLSELRDWLLPMLMNGQVTLK